MRLCSFLYRCALLICVCGALQLNAQNFTGINDSIINLKCNEPSAALKFQVPHLKSSNRYAVNTIKYTPYPYTTSTGNALPASFYTDDVYSSKITLPFPVCFYGDTYTEVVIGSNGLLTFDVSNANCLTAPWVIDVPIPYGGTTQCGNDLYYPRASIMGVYSDLNASSGTAAPPDRKMEWRVEGVAPFRRFVASWFHVGVYGTDCGLNEPLTFQIVINEATAVIDVFIENKQCFPNTSGGRAILGVQNWNQDQAVAAPGKNATQWTAQKEGFRFTPSGGTSRFVSSELLTIGGAFLQTAIPVESATEGLMDITFPNPITPAAASEQYIIRTTYSSCIPNGNAVIVNDTITINKSVLPIILTSTQTNCAGPSGTITATIDPSAGSVGPYTFQILPGGTPVTVNTGNSYTFTGLATGNYIISASSSGCSGTQPATVTSSGTFPVTFTVNPPSCAGAQNASVAFTLPAAGNPYIFTLTGSPATVVNNVVTNLAGDRDYFIYIEAQTGCFLYVPVRTPAGSNSLTATVTSTTTSCSGVNNGTVTVTATSGSGPYEFSIDNGVTWVTGTNPYTFNNLAPNTYNIKVKEGACISNSFPITVTAGTTIDFAATATATTCDGAANGSIVINSATGVAPHTYSIGGGPQQTGNTFANLAAGSYIISVRDAAGCIAPPKTIIITAGARITGSGTSTATSCVGVNNGTITLTSTAIGAPYMYSLDGGPFQAGNTFTGVSAGNHNGIVQNTLGCVTANIPVVVAAGTGITATFVSNPTACAGVNNGSIVITPTNGTAPHNFSIDGGAPQTSNTFTNVAPGMHDVIVKDALGCSSAVLRINVDAGTVLLGTVSSTATSCNGAINGTITATPSNGAAPYQYSLDGGPLQSSNVFNAVSAGDHAVVIRDNFGCQSVSMPVKVVAGNALNATATATSTTCSGATNGTITVTAPTNGIAPYLYSLNGAAPQVSNVFNNLTNSSYNIIVTDAGGCTSGTIAVTVNAGVAVTVSLTPLNVNCFGGNNGSITAAVSVNATAPVLYSLDNTNFQASNIFGSLVANDYTIYFKDAAGCTNSATTTVTQPAVLTATTVVKDVLCNAASNGTITISAAGGTLPYQYSLDNTNYQSSPVFNVAAGNYTVYVRDGRVCTTQLNGIIVSEPNTLTATATTVDATCDGGSDGTINVVASGGTAPYQYAVGNGTFQSTAQLKVLSGTYTVTVKDANGCTFDVPNVTVGLQNTLTFTPMADPAAICEGSTIILQPVTNAKGFAWSPTTGVNNISAAAPGVAPATTTTYMVTYTLGVCTATDDVTVTVLPAPIPAAGDDAEICYGQNYQLQGTGGVSYKWSPASNLSSTVVPDPEVIRPLQSMRYSLAVVGTNGCPSLRDDEMTLTVIPPIKVTISPADTVVFSGAQFPITASSIGVNYNWDPAIGLSNIAGPKALVTAPETGREVVYRVIASTAAGCEGEGTARVRVYEGPDIYMANAFTPNADGKNDFFGPFPVGIKEIKKFFVFNRWGQTVYSSTSLNKGWDGRFKGQEQGSGVYTWLVTGITTDGRTITKKGTVVLIR